MSSLFEALVPARFILLRFGVDEMVNRSGGFQLREARRALQGCRTGEAKITPSFGHTNVQHIIHAVNRIKCAISIRSYDQDAIIIHKPLIPTHFLGRPSVSDEPLETRKTHYRR